jgi:BON domain
MFESVAFRRWLLSVFAVGFIMPPSVAHERVTKSADCTLSERIETAILNDDGLRSAKLLVSVVDGVAVVGGSVDSLVQQQRVQELLQQVPGVRESKLSTWIPRVERVSQKIDPRPLANVVSQRHELPPLLLEPITQHRPPTSAYSPLPAPVPPAPNGPPEFPTIPPPAVPVVPKQDVAAAVEVVRVSTTKFSELKTEMKAGVVTISGFALDVGDAWELAELVRKVPGIDRVIVGAVRER